MKNRSPTVYLKAAKLLQSHPMGACTAVSKIHGSANSKYQYKLEHYMRHNTTGYWYNHKEDSTLDEEFMPYTDLGCLGRQIMLLFMYEIVKDENRRSK